MELTVMMAALVIGIILLVIPVAAYPFLVRKPEVGEVLIRTTPAGSGVLRMGAPSLTLPALHRTRAIDGSAWSQTVTMRGSRGLVCKDFIRADIVCTWHLILSRAPSRVLQACSRVGIDRIGDTKARQDFVEPRLQAAMATVAHSLEFDRLYRDREEACRLLLMTIGDTLDGFDIDAVRIDYLEHTPVDALDPQNMLDAQGLRAIYASHPGGA